MKKQFMVRIVRDIDEDWVDVVVDSEEEEEAKAFALAIVRASPDSWFGAPPPIRYFVDDASDVEDVSDCGYASANEVKP